MRHYHAYRLFPRLTEFNTLFRAQRLFQQYLVDAAATIDQNHLVWIRNNALVYLYLAAIRIIPLLIELKAGEKAKIAIDQCEDKQAHKDLEQWVFQEVNTYLVRPILRAVTSF
jgi:helitron helicase-like protein